MNGRFNRDSFSKARMKASGEPSAPSSDCIDFNTGSYSSKNNANVWRISSYLQSENKIVERST